MAAIRMLADDERDWANARYRDIAFAESPPGTLAVIAELDGERVGLGRLVRLAPDVLELGGIWTTEAARGRGVARAIVNALLDHAPPGERLWCIPFEHLAAFYESCGFAAAPRPWPAAITGKVGDCGATHRAGVVVLVRAR
jgi:GNAT superfamily N-acetyltransferase